MSSPEPWRQLPFEPVARQRPRSTKLASSREDGRDPSRCLQTKVRYASGSPRTCWSLVGSVLDSTRAIGWISFLVRSSLRNRRIGASGGEEWKLHNSPAMRSASLHAVLTPRPQRSAPARRSLSVVAAASDSRGATPLLAAVAAPTLALGLSALAVSTGHVPSRDATEAYFRLTAGFVFDADAAGQVPLVLKQWFHGANMGLALAAMGGYGAFLGWQVRAGKGSEPTLTGSPTRDLHPQLMGVMTAIFVAGGSGGALFNLLLDRPVFQSPHAVTALAGLGLLAANGALSTVMKGSPALRTTHAFLGTGLMAVFVAHAALGVELALRIGAEAAAAA